MIRRVFIAIAAATLLASCVNTSPTPEATYYLVRHAEKTKDKSDPALTMEGQKRAQDLVQRLASEDINKIYASDYRRTRDTAAPIADAQGLSLEIYDPRDLEGFAKTLLLETGHILVVGHSNTTPALSGLLGGDTGTPIVEASEYDRLYIIERFRTETKSRIERYGD